MSVSAPPLKKGWLKKLSRSGMIKSWQNRYFVLNAGRLYYFKDQADCFPYGEELKGDLSLSNANIAQQNFKQTDKQIFIHVGNGDNNILMEADTSTLAMEWITAIKEHCHYAQTALQAGEFEDSEASLKISKRSSKNLSNKTTTESSPRSSKHNNDMNGSDSLTRSTSYTRSSSYSNKNNTDSSAATHHSITPAPAWVVKVHQLHTGEKVFVNLCEHSDVPAIHVPLSFNKWPFMVFTPSRIIHEDSEDTTGTMVFDIIVHPSVIALCDKDSKAKDAVCQRVVRLLTKQYELKIETEYKLPKILKRYKGALQTVSVPVDLIRATKAGTNVFVCSGEEGEKVDRDSHAQSALDTHSGNGNGKHHTTEDGHKTGNGSGSDHSTHSHAKTQQPNSTHYDEHNIATRQNGTSTAHHSPQPHASSMLQTMAAHSNGHTSPSSSPKQQSTKLVRQCVPYMVTRENGTVAKQTPTDKFSPGKVVSTWSIVLVTSRKVFPDGLAWLKTTEGGWIQEMVSLGSLTRVLEPAIYGQPIGVKVVSTKFDEYFSPIPATTSWSFFGTCTAALVAKQTFQTIFILDILYSDDCVTRLSRSFADIETGIL